MDSQPQAPKPAPDLRTFMVNGPGPALAHLIPFAAWLILMQALGEPAGWKYALRTVLGLGLLLWARPWRWYPRFQIKNLPPTLGVGVLVLLVWIVPEMGFMDHFPALKAFYFRFLVMPFGQLPPYVDPQTLRHLAESPYRPDVCGWALALTRLAGSAFVIAIAEEFFWRGFLYRWLIQRDFTDLSLRAFELQPFLIMVALFGFEHDRWLVGMFAGAAYGGLLLLTGDIWAAVLAHVLTNFLLGLYVLGSGNYGFW